MSVLLMLSISLAVAAGVWLVLTRDTFRVIVGLAVLGAAANLIVFAAARPAALVPAVIEAGATRLPAGITDPLPQALVLTAIVIGFALLCFALVLGARLAGGGADPDPDRMREAEPVATDPVKPPVLED